MGGLLQRDLAEAGGSAVTTYDFAPLLRTAIGFDRLARLMDTATSAPDASSYPPYNIERTGEDNYRLTMAVAGFRPEELDLVVKDNTMVVSGKASSEGQTGEMLYRGIAGRAFERRFVLADHIVVDGADLQNGLLHVGLKRVVPEALKPRRIAIGGTAKAVANDSAGAVKAA
jgi:molecular chaperone IbpA